MPDDRLPQAHRPVLDFELLFRHAIDALLVVNAVDSTVLYINETTKQLLRCDQTLIGQPLSSLFAPPDDAEAPAQVTAYGGVFQEQRLRRADGSVCIVDLSATLVNLDPDGDEAQHVVVLNLRDATERQRVEQERERLIAELRTLLAEVKTLSGLLPICAVCKKIRDDGGYWRQIEIYVRDHSDAQFSHGLCPTCAQELGRELK